MCLTLPMVGEISCQSTASCPGPSPAVSSLGRAERLCFSLSKWTCEQISVWPYGYTSLRICVCLSVHAAGPPCHRGCLTAPRAAQAHGDVLLGLRYTEAAHSRGKSAAHLSQPAVRGSQVGAPPSPACKLCQALGRGKWMFLSFWCEDGAANESV